MQMIWLYRLIYVIPWAAKQQHLVHLFIGCSTFLYLRSLGRSWTSSLLLIISKFWAIFIINSFMNSNYHSTFQLQIQKAPFFHPLTFFDPSTQVFFSLLKWMLELGFTSARTTNFTLFLCTSKSMSLPLKIVCI